MNSDAGFWCFTLGCGLVFGLLAICFMEHILIHSTAIFGSFIAVYGIGLVAGGYQNPFTIVTEINSGLKTNIDPIFYAYMAGNIVMYIVGALFQYKQRRGDKEKGHNPYAHRPYHYRK